jgi:hypothetical protein
MRRLDVGCGTKQRKPPMTEADLTRQEVDYYMPPELEERRAAAARFTLQGLLRGWLASQLRRLGAGGGP